MSFCCRLATQGHSGLIDKDSPYKEVCPIDVHTATKRALMRSETFRFLTDHQRIKQENLSKDRRGRISPPGFKEIHHEEGEVR